MRATDGKARWAQNATKHGLSSQRLIVREDEHEEFEEFRRGLRNQLKPVGAMEEEVYRQLLRGAWNPRRIERLAKYQARFERSFYRATRELRRLQTDRVLRFHAHPLVTHLATGLVSTTELTKRTQKMEAADVHLAVFDEQIAAIDTLDDEQKAKAA